MEAEEVFGQWHVFPERGPSGTVVDHPNWQGQKQSTDTEEVTMAT